MAQHILFVCTGNIFRSMVAEHALRGQYGTDGGYRFESAGIEAKPQSIHPTIRTWLVQNGIDPVGHVQRKLTQELIDRIDLIVAMGFDHREWIRQRFSRHALLFNQVALDTDTPILDLHEAVLDWERNPDGARRYVESVIDHIWGAAPSFMARLPHFLSPTDDSAILPVHS